MTDCNSARCVAVGTWGYKSQLFERSWFFHMKTQQLGTQGLLVPDKRASKTVRTRPSTRCHIPQQFNLQQHPVTTSLSHQRTEQNKAKECRWQARPGMRADAIWLAPDLCLTTLLPFSTMRCVTMRHRTHVCRTCSYTFDTEHLPGRQIDRPEPADSTVDDSQKQV